MHSIIASALAGVITGALAIAGSCLPAAAQQKGSLREQLVGTWVMTSNSGKASDGTPSWGENPSSLLILTDNGRFSTQIFRSDRPKFASNNRLAGTAAEDKATSAGTISYFGTYEVDEIERTITYNIDYSSFPNWNGTRQKRPVTSITAETMTLTNAAPSGGGTPSVIVWTRQR